ncbi:MAG: hypothetical protein JSW08_00115, partial [archaeon]
MIKSNKRWKIKRTILILILAILLTLFLVNAGNLSILSINGSDILNNTDNGSGEINISLENISIEFDRDLDCHKCGKHKAPPITNVNMIITAEFEGTLQNITFSDYYNKEWQVTNSNNGTIEEVNNTYNKISWFIESADNTIEKSYIVFSPQRTLPPTNYYFQTELEEQKSDWWRVIISDPLGNETIIYGYKYSTFHDGDFNLTSKAKIKCDAIDNEWKNCTSILEIDNDYQNIVVPKATITSAINIPSRNLIIYNTTQFSYWYEPIYNYTTNYTEIKCFENSECDDNNESTEDFCYLNESNLSLCVYTYPVLIYNATRRNFEDFTLTPTNLIINEGISAIRFDFQVPSWQSGSFNLTVGTYTLDPEIDACAELNSANEVYTLNQSVQSDDTCMNISAENVTLDCDGFDI